MTVPENHQDGDLWLLKSQKPRVKIRGCPCRSLFARGHHAIGVIKKVAFCPEIGRPDRQGKQTEVSDERHS